MSVSPRALALSGPARSTARGSTTARTVARLEDVYREQHAYVWRALVRLGVPESAVADAVHDVFMVVARRLDEFEGRSSLRTWLFAIALRVAWSARRDAARERARAAELATGGGVHAPHESADAAEELQRLLDELDDDKRAVFVMAELEDMTAPEIAVVLGIKIPTVYSRLRLAREALERAARRARAQEERRRR